MYEKFRNDFVLELAELPSETTNIIINALDRVALKYEFTQKELILATYKKELPNIAKLYLVVKKMAGLSDGTLNNYKLILELFFNQVMKPPELIEPNDTRMFLFIYQQDHGVSFRTLDKYREYI